MRIDVFADLVCPWCHLGHRRLAEALQLAGAEDAEVHWHAYQLDPTAPVPSGPMRPAIEARYGEGAFASMRERLGSLGRAAGLEFDFDAARRCNTFDAHRLLAWARADASLHAALLERLFSGALERGEDLADRTMLVGIVDEVGGDADRAGELLAGDAFADEVDADRALAAELDLTGVPAFVFERSFVVPGAQDADRLAELIRRLRDRAERSG